MMKIRFYFDPGTGEPHIYNHDVNEAEAEDVLVNPGEDRPGPEGSLKLGEDGTCGLSTYRIQNRTAYSL